MDLLLQHASSHEYHHRYHQRWYTVGAARDTHAQRGSCSVRAALRRERQLRHDAQLQGFAAEREVPHSECDLKHKAQDDGAV